jgi:hypothetical protein
VGHTFVEAAADFMKQYESVFAEEFDGGAPARATRAGEDREGTREGRR